MYLCTNEVMLFQLCPLLVFTYPKSFTWYFLCSLSCSVSFSQKVGIFLQRRVPVLFSHTSDYPFGQIPGHAATISRFWINGMAGSLSVVSLAIAPVHPELVPRFISMQNTLYRRCVSSSQTCKPNLNGSFDLRGSIQKSLTITLRAHKVPELLGLQKISFGDHQLPSVKEAMTL